ncbi:hypothetical protein BCR33DRAFT_854861 [Rhizoclosmatium globosum]|uniref:HNH nuclease domain-containing protein n=1 Tax=Rhizoclosmatium globosum TaxID=329046 RepID=A0A1Y2BT41_9FUNG|nr:hypothetical protein BCR33DRAFT_854861 [Rhizoclosmatium globosum]|eukprot:ORY37295.1 hypothetical protein BCR33DRAFT_854861 [Rhizoclosmatium globosum]
MNIAYYQNAPEEPDVVETDAVDIGSFSAAPGDSKRVNGLIFKVMTSWKKISTYTETLPEELYHLLVVIPTAPISSFPLNEPSAPSHLFAISIWNAIESENILLAIPYRLTGKAWSRVQLFLSSICGDFNPNHYSLKSADETNTTLTELHLTDSDMLAPGRYYLIAKEGVPSLDVIYRPFPIIPRGKKAKSASGSSSPTGSPSSASKKRTRISAILDDVDDSVLVEAAIEENNRRIQFGKQIIARDNHCVITKACVSTQATHILDHSFLSNGINSVRNGILLRSDLATAFDNGLFSFHFRDGHYYFVAISVDLECFDGQQLDENLRVRADNSTWWSLETCPQPKLVKFHLRNSIFQHMRDSTEVIDMDLSDDEDFVDESVSMARMRVQGFFGESEVGKTLSKRITANTLVNLLDEENF